MAKIILFCFESKMATMAAILKFFKLHLLPNRKSPWAETEMGGIIRDSELLKSFCSDIQDDRHGRLEILQTTYPPKP